MVPYGNSPAPPDTTGVSEPHHSHTVSYQIQVRVRHMGASLLFFYRSLF